jgi:hypothetical protein
MGFRKNYHFFSSSRFLWGRKPAEIPQALWRDLKLWAPLLLLLEVLSAAWALAAICGGLLYFSVGAQAPKEMLGAISIAIRTWPLIILPLAVGAVVKTVVTRRFERKVRDAEGLLCVACGYDLRGSKGACPECGREFSPRNTVRFWSQWCDLKDASEDA